MGSRFVEFPFRLTAAGALPVLRQVFEFRSGRDPVRRIADGGIIDRAADGAHIFPRRLLDHDFAGRGIFDRVIQIHDPLRFEMLITERRMGRAVNGGILADEGADAVQRVPRRRQIFEDDRKLVRIQRFVGVGDVAVHHVKKPVALGDDDAVALGVSLGGQQINAVGDLFGGVEGVIRTILVLHAHDIRTVELQRVRLLGGEIDLRVGEAPQLPGVVLVLVGHEDLRHLLGAIAQGPEGGHIVDDAAPQVDLRILVDYHVGKFRRQSRIHQNDLVAGVDEIVLKARAVADFRIEFFHSVFTAQSERLRHEPLLVEFDCLDFHAASILFAC